MAFLTADSKKEKPQTGTPLLLFIYYKVYFILKMMSKAFWKKYPFKEENRFVGNDGMKFS